MRLPRMTTRRWMFAVAAVAVVIGLLIEGARWKRRRDYGLYWAGFHAHLESGIRPDCRPGCPHSAAANPRAGYHAQLRRAYELAVRSPWASFPDDPVKDRWKR